MPGWRAEGVERRAVEGADHAARRRAVPLEHAAQRLGRGGGLHLDEQRRVGVALEHLLDRRHAHVATPEGEDGPVAREPRAGVRAADAIEGERATAPLASVVRSSVSIVDDDDAPVGREVDIELERVGTVRERQIEAAERVLGRVRARAAVADDEPGGGVEQRRGHGSGTARTTTAASSSPPFSR